MSAKQNAYLSLEASYILPIVLLLFISIIWAALHLYSRCSLSQNQYENLFNSMKVTFKEANKKEVIYDEKVIIYDFEEFKYLESNPVKLVREGR